MPKILIVNKNDEPIGASDKLEAYYNGLIHRVVRILVFSSKGELLLQKRGPNQKTFPNTWDQSAGGHVDEGEDYELAVKRELAEELGIENLNLEEIDKFYVEGVYKNKKNNRFNKLYKCTWDGDIKIQKSEVSEVSWFNVEDLKEKIRKNEIKTTDGLKYIIDKYL